MKIKAGHVLCIVAGLGAVTYGVCKIINTAEEMKENSLTKLPEGPFEADDFTDEPKAEAEVVSE